ncbi:hypothetical protein, partial [uncultured Mucilaginibacter sp.]|uniref:hypothetical protein n=1 Tax=uncultured Mucilaginibacter sp. TaxID=797541 RepID=UPI0025F16D00
MNIKIFVFLSAFTFYLAPCLAQEYVFDPQYFASVMANQGVRSSAEATHNQYLAKINTNIEDINTNVGSVVLAQEIIYLALSNVNSALKDGLEVKNMAVITADMISYLDQALALAKAQPALLLVASNIENEMRLKAVGLVTDVSGFVLKEGDNMLADYSVRDQLLRKVIQQLQILDGLAYGAW